MENNVLSINNKKWADKLDEERKLYISYLARTLRELVGTQAKIVKIDAPKKQSA